MISRLSKRSGGLQALDSLSLTLDDHELVGFVGANGAGKSTTMRIVMGALAMIIVIMGGGQTIAMGVVEEKSSRIVEILLACVRPGSLLAGKILGTGVAVILGYGLIGLAAGAAAELTGVLPEALFSIDAVVVAMIVWMIVGCAIAAAAYGAAGALVSRQEDTASVTMPLTMLFMIPYMLSFVMAMDPSKTVFRVLAYLPPLSPFLMPARLVLGVSSWAEQLVALVVALAFIPLLVGLAATVYTRAVTRTGSRMRLKEVLSRETARRDHRAAPVAPSRRDRSSSGSRSVRFRIEIGPVPGSAASGSQAAADHPPTWCEPLAGAWSRRPGSNRHRTAGLGQRLIEGFLEGSGARGSVDEMGEPDRDLALGRLRRVGAVDEVHHGRAAPVAAQIAADGPRGRSGRLGGADEGAQPLDHPMPLDDDGDQRAAGHVLHDAGVEGLVDVLRVVLGQHVGGRHEAVERDDLVALGLDAAQDLPGQPASDGVGLDEDEHALGGVGHDESFQRESRRSEGATAPRRPRKGPGRQRVGDRLD